MALYAIGDVQGCYDALQRLLTKIKYDPAVDTLWFVGDLVSRGGQSLEVLRLLMSLPPKHLKIVLGNNDFHLLYALSLDNPKQEAVNEEFLTIYDAHDQEKIQHWLSTQPLFHYDKKTDFAMVHAAIDYSWSIKKAKKYSNKISAILTSNKQQKLMKHLYGNSPSQWSKKLTDWERIRCLINIFTRARFVSNNGKYNFKEKGSPFYQKSDLVPWFALKRKHPWPKRLIFGHWSSLGLYDKPPLLCLDTGYVWGGQLTAVKLGKKLRFYVVDNN